MQILIPFAHQTIMTTNKIVLLDIDGPMIPTRAAFLPNQSGILTIFDPCAVAMLNLILTISGAKVVISSTWASHGKERCETLLRDNGVICTLHDDWRTPRKMSSTRTHEISWWLRDHPEITHYVALDDEMLDASILPGFVQCDTYEGFSFRNMLEAKVLLDIATDQEKETLLFVRRKEIWRTQRHGDPKEHLTWKFADDLFPVEPNLKPHWYRGIEIKE